MLSTKNSDWVSEINPRKPLFSIPIGEIWRYRDLILLLIRRDLVAAHKQTIMGPLWFIIQPVISALMFTLIFNRILKIGTDGIPAMLFNLSGVVIWYYFSSCFTGSANTFSSNAGLFSKVYFPRLVMPIAQSVTNLWQFLIQFLIFLCFYFYFLAKGYPIHPSYRVVIIPFLIAQTALLGIGAGCFISAMTTRFKDLQLVIGPGLQLLMYASCIFFPRSQVGPNFQWLMNLNPIVPIIEAFRFALMGRGEVFISQWLISLGITVVIVVVGIIEFERAEKTFADTI